MLSQMEKMIWIFKFEQYIHLNNWNQLSHNMYVSVHTIAHVINITNTNNKKLNVYDQIKKIIVETISIIVRYKESQSMYDNIIY